MMRFFVSPSHRVTDDVLQQAYLSGFDHNPWLIKAEWKEHANEAPGELVLHRAVSDSASLFIPWPVEGHGLVTLSTSNLMERKRAYYLPHELARGKISQLRNQITDWQSHGLAVGQDVFKGLHEALSVFRQSMQHPHGSAESASLAERSLKIALDTAVNLAHRYTEQALALKSRSRNATKTLFGAELGDATLNSETARAFATSFNAAQVPLPWSDIESSEGDRRWELVDRQIAWCKANRLAVLAGPLLQFDKHSVPDWLYLFEEDFESLISAATEFAEAAVERYHDQVDVWLCAARANTADMLALCEEEIVRITAELIERTKSMTPEKPLIVSFDQPWIEYAARRKIDVPPLHLADLLIRADLGLSGLMLEINMGYHPGGTLPRDIVEFSRQLDVWAALGMPLYASLCVADSSAADPLAKRQVSSLMGGGPTDSQAAWIARYMPLMMAKPYIHGVFWNQLSDAQHHDFPNGGLFDHQGSAKPSLAALASIPHHKRVR